MTSVGFGFVAPANAGVASPNWCLAGTQTGDSTEIYVDINACTDYVPSVKGKAAQRRIQGPLPLHRTAWIPLRLADPALAGRRLDAALPGTGSDVHQRPGV